ncbi:MAG: hypothetical protein EA378_01400 [Phycisphaerales bacterium]|nr:MAG: hypothetical protein EA378_01400 [Phycisphaerales bacterium]
MKRRIPLILITLSLMVAGMLLYAALQELIGEFGESRPVSAGRVHEAALMNDLEALRREVQAGVDLNAPDEGSGSRTSGLTPLMAAAFAGHQDGMRLLIDGGARADARGREGRNALFYAAGWGGVGCVRMLLEASPPARVDARSDDGWTPTMMAASRGEYEALRALLAAGANVDAKNRWGETALLLATEAQSSEKVRALLGAGANVNEGDNTGRTPIAAAAASGESAIELLELLLASGADPNVEDRDGVTPLMRAASRGDPARVILLLNAGALADPRDEAGDRALDWARRRDDALGREVADILRLAPGGGS